MLIPGNKNKIHNFRSFGLVFGLISLLFTSSTFAQDDSKKKSNPIGGGSSWNTEVKKGEVETKPADMDDETRAFVQTISDYFNGIINLQGEFLQTDPENRQVRGDFFVKRPGKLRFDYAPPSKLRIVADGRWLSIEDHDLKTIDRYPLESTPFRLLLSEKVDLLKDAKIVDISRGESVAIITVADKEDDSTGQLKLFFSIPELQLKQWVITDPQGLDTRIELGELVLDQDKKDEFFKVADEASFAITD